MAVIKPKTDAAPKRTGVDDRRLATRIREQRRSHGWTQRELSQRSGISPDRLSRVERGASIRVDELVALSRTLGLGLDELMFAPAAGAPGASAEDLARQVLRLIPPEDLPPLTRLLQVLASGLRAHGAVELKGDAK
jgi:transcriptional regulator with XRE-family HTH domain